MQCLEILQQGPAIEDLNNKPNELTGEEGNLIVKERHVGLTTEQLAEKTKGVFGSLKPSSGDLLHKYLYPLINQGVIDKVQSEIDKRQNIYFPVEKESIFSIFENPNDFRLRVRNPDIYPCPNVIEESIRSLLDYCSEGGEVSKNKRFMFIDVDGKEITIDELIDKYFNFPESCFTKDWYPSQEQAATIKNINHNSEIQILRQKNSFVGTII